MNSEHLNENKASLDSLVETVFSYIATYLSPEDYQFVEKAYHFAYKSHLGQMRASGHPYIIHPVIVVGILAEARADAVTLVAGFLHDTVEDTSVKLADIEAEFGQEVALIVDGLTKVTLPNTPPEVLRELTYQKIFTTAAQNLRVILIKLADRLHNIRTLGYIDRMEKRHRIANETLAAYVPLANFFGLNRIKWEMENLALSFAEKSKFHKTLSKITAYDGEQKHHEFCIGLRSFFERDLRLANIKDVSVVLLPRYIYAIFEKMDDQDLEDSLGSNVVALRIFVNTIEDCYRVNRYLAEHFVVKDNWSKNYVEKVKLNHYRSLHTTLLVQDDKGQPHLVEIQIRTYAMHAISERALVVYLEEEAQGQLSKEIEGFKPRIRLYRQLVKDLETGKLNLANFKAKIDYNQKGIHSRQVK